ncbi:DEAD/DEAH box helicase [Gryllotalpicola protaetiae]|uniref:DEAD/DEAH box helicase n=1 Tax=Gryllotalpicola protaetiae TaxID=2419771 RepID=A0A387BQT2_9MICO|nr:DEAD/DEAH box helicase [Gryllotalpicola protaetiae]AYG03347.1 DEAD/DEAH box helicase [Gryllotalpicola protaetiae]
MAESEWKRKLRGLARADATTDAAGEAAPPPRTPLGVQFEVREVVRRGSGRWQHTSNTTVAATAESIGALRLAVRPVMPGRSAAKPSGTNWVGANLTWAGLQYQVHQLGLDPAQVRWFTEFAALARAASGGFLGQDGARIALDEFGSPLLWPLLRQARELGVALVGVGREPVLRVGGQASARLDASAASDGTVTLSPVVSIDAVDVSGLRLGAIGAHGLWAVEWPGPIVRLAPAEQAITAETLKLLASDPLVVPGAERAEFFADFAPSLPLPITSADASVWLPRPPAAPEDGEAARLETITPGEPPAPEDYLTATPELEVTLVPSEDRDWLDLGFTVHVEGREVPFSTLFEALAGGRKSLRLVDGSYLRLNQPVFARLMDLIAEADALREWEAGPRIHRTQLALWSDFEDLADQASAAVEWREQVTALTDAPAEAAPVPEGLTAELREYQRAGLTWLAYLYDHGLGGILADDMGLGKTLQTLALILHAQADRPWLVVAPASVVSNWVAEAAKFAPTLRVASVARTQLREKRKLTALARDNDVIVMSYNLFRLDFDDVEDVRWAGLVLDEAQFVKNHRSRAHECAKALDTPFKLAITGTPLENNVLELWSILDIVAPGLFPSIRRFTEQYVRPLSHVREPDAVPAGISAADAQRVIARLRKRVRPFLLRRTKALVAPELPAKQEQVIRVELTPKHRRLYEQFLQRERQKLLGLVKEDFDRQKFILFRSLTLLRMLALDAALIDEQYEGVPSAKLDALLEQLAELVDEGHRALVFSQFTSYLRRVEARLDDAGIAYEYLDGSTTNRADVIARFKSGAAPVFLISLKAGGFGINLTEADYVFLLDPWWNPASEAQAVDRAHRIGQASAVNVYRLVADGTIEDKVMKLRDEKAELFGQVLDDDGTFSELLSADDVRGLLEL